PPGPHRRLRGRSRGVLGGRLRAAGGARQPDPQLRAPHVPTRAGAAVTLISGWPVALVQQLEALVGQGVETDVIPDAQPLRGGEAERLAGAFGVDGERAERLRDL